MNNRKVHFLNKALVGVGDPILYSKRYGGNYRKRLYTTIPKETSCPQCIKKLIKMGLLEKSPLPTQLKLEF